jgi:hypothetical protein
MSLSKDCIRPTLAALPASLFAPTPKAAQPVLEFFTAPELTTTTPGNPT